MVMHTAPVSSVVPRTATEILTVIAAEEPPAPPPIRSPAPSGAASTAS